MFPAARFLALLLMALVPTGAHAAVDYRIDPAHSAVTFSLSHLGVARSNGRLGVVSGRFHLDPVAMANSQAEIELDPASVDTGLPERDTHLRSAEFFDVATFPKIRFTSRAASGTAWQFTLDGDLSLHGITRPVRFAVRKIGEGKDPWGGYRIGYQATATVSRKAFGMDFMAGAVGDEVTVVVDIEGIRTP